MSMFKRLASAAAFLTLLLWGPSAFAQCVFSGGSTYTCSGAVGSTTIVGTNVGDTFVITDGTTGSLTLMSGGGNDTLDLSGFTTPVSLNLGFSGSQAVAAGLAIDVQGFDAPGSAYTVRGGTADDILTGAAGNDTFFGGAGADALNGAGGTDTRGDTNVPDCLTDTLSSIEADLCPVPVPVPTLSEWALIALGLVLAAAAWLGLRARRLV